MEVMIILFTSEQGCQIFLGATYQNGENLPTK
jgi:hypothetical protein